MAHPIAWLDTNVIIRFVTADHPDMTPESAALMKQAEEGKIMLKVAAMVIAECCWVLQSPHYGFTPGDIAGVLTSLLAADGIEADEEDILILALQAYAEHNVNFIDAYLAVRARMSGQEVVATFNSKDFTRLGANHAHPSHLII